MLVGLLVLCMPVFPRGYIPLLLGVAGAVLVFRGLLGIVLFARSKETR